MKVNLENFLRDGTFGLIKFGMTREELQGLIGLPDGEFQRRKDRFPTAFEYGDIEFYFLSSADNRLCTIYLDNFIISRGNQQIELDSWFLEGKQSLEAIESVLTERKIEFQSIERPDLSQKHLVTQSEVILCFDCSDDEIFKLSSISLSHREKMEIYEPSKQISITIPLREYEKIRIEAERQRQKMSKICSQWIIERVKKLK